MPADMNWPMWREQPLIFMAQIALRDLAGTAVSAALPADGLLSFWYAGAEHAWGFDPAESGAARAIHSPDGTDLVERPIPDGMPHDGPLAACTWLPREELTIPPWECALVEGWQLSREELDLYLALPDAVGLREDLTTHRLLGHPDPVQGDMQLECQLVTNGLYCGDASGFDDARRRTLEAGAKEWRLLLQIDSDDVLGSEWGDTGRVYFWIRDRDLAARRFDSAWHVMQCS
jgi:uncharacterized protein YwqG